MPCFDLDDRDGYGNCHPTHYDFCKMLKFLKFREYQICQKIEVPPVLEPCTTSKPRSFYWGAVDRDSLYRDWLKFSGYAPPYDREFGDDRVCNCGHVYHRHFDSYEDMFPRGCKYCSCEEFVEATSIPRQCSHCNSPDVVCGGMIKDPLTKIRHWWAKCAACAEPVDQEPS